MALFFLLVISLFTIFLSIDAVTASGLVGVYDWADACVKAVLESNITTGFIDGSGTLMASYSNETWGITRPVCDEICGWNTIRQVCYLPSLSRSTSLEHLELS
jgi:hypothetical protein